MEACESRMHSIVADRGLDFTYGQEEECDEM
jgi:hypothetical protein